MKNLRIIKINNKNKFKVIFLKKIILNNKKLIFNYQLDKILQLNKLKNRYLKLLQIF